VETRYIRVDPKSFEPSELEGAAAILRGGGLVAFPTETVYGLGANALDPAAIERLREAKRRPAEKHFTLHIASADDVPRFVEEVPRGARVLIGRYWPGPLTIVFPSKDGEGIGLRVPASEVARELIRLVGSPLAAPSANPAGLEPATDAEQVRAYFDGAIDAVVDGGPAVIKQASTVVRFDANGYEILRSGMITPEMIHQLLVGKNILFVCSGNSCRSPMAAALFRKLLAEKLGYRPDDLGELGYSIHSAGTHAYLGGYATENAILALAERGIDISNHISRPLTADMVRVADVVYAMSPSHVRQIREWSPESEGKIRLLNERGIADPIGGDLSGYEACAVEIEKALTEILKGA